MWEKMQGEKRRTVLAAGREKVGIKEEKETSRRVAGGVVSNGRGSEVTFCKPALDACLGTVQLTEWWDGKN